MRLLLLIFFSFAMGSINYEVGAENFKPTIRVRPSYTVGKMTNGNFYSEIMPLRIAWFPLPEWSFGLGYSMGFESPRSNPSLIGNHRGWATRASAQYKPLKFLQVFFPESTLTDFYIKYEKQISDYYDGSTLSVGRLNYDDWEEFSIGFDFTI